MEETASFSDIASWVRMVQDWRSQLEVWGVNASVLALIGLVAFILFLLTAREVLSWYLKTGQVRDEIRELRAQVTQLQQAIEDLHEIREKRDVPAQKISAASKDGDDKLSKLFRLDH